MRASLSSKTFPKKSLIPRPWNAHSDEYPQDGELKAIDVTAPPVFDSLINKTPFTKFPFSKSGRAISHIRNTMLNESLSTKTNQSEPTTPNDSTDSTPDKVLKSSKSLGYEQIIVRGILKRKEKSRFSYYDKSNQKKRQQSAPRVKIVEEL